MFTCGFFNSVAGDRKYNSRQISQMFDGILTDGVLAHYGEHFAITPVSGMQLNIGSGRFWFNHVWGLNDGNTIVQLDPSDISANRIDAVMIEVDSSDEVRNAFIKIKKGSANGPKPSMTNIENFHQYPLAYITVNAGVSSITSANIEVVIGTSECPFSTGILESVAIDNLFQQWDGQFGDWFANLKASMTGNVVTNLQNQIDSTKNEILGLQNKINSDVMNRKVLVDFVSFSVSSMVTAQLESKWNEYSKFEIYGWIDTNNSSNTSLVTVGDIYMNVDATRNVGTIIKRGYEAIAPFKLIIYIPKNSSYYIASQQRVNNGYGGTNITYVGASNANLNGEASISFKIANPSSGAKIYLTAVGTK